MGTVKRKVPYVTGQRRTNGRYESRPGLRYYRVVPPQLRPLVGRSSWCHTFPPDTPWAQVEAKADSLRRQHDMILEKANAGYPIDDNARREVEDTVRQMMDLPSVERHNLMAFLAGDEKTTSAIDRAAMVAVEHGGRIKEPGLSLRAAYERDKAEYGGQRDERPIERAVEDAKSVLGDRCDLTQVSRSEVRRWLDTMRSRVGEATVRRRHGAMRALVGRLYRDRELERPNPFAEHDIGGAGSGHDRLPMHRTHLDALELYLINGKGGETADLLRLMQYTGAGPAELAGLTLADVSLSGPIPFIHVRPNAIRSLKTGSRARRLPLVRDALPAARAAVERAKARAGDKPPEQVQLFECFRAGSDRPADNASARLNKAMRNAGATFKGGRLSAYSLRHTVEEAMREAGVAYELQQRIMGHAAEGQTGNYGSTSARLEAARDALERAADHFGQVDETMFRSDEWPDHT